MNISDMEKPGIEDGPDPEVWQAIEKFESDCERMHLAARLDEVKHELKELKEQHRLAMWTLGFAMVALVIDL